MRTLDFWPQLEKKKTCWTAMAEESNPSVFAVQLKPEDPGLIPGFSLSSYF